MAVRVSNNPGQIGLKGQAHITVKNLLSLESMLLPTLGHYALHRFWCMG